MGKLSMEANHHNKHKVGSVFQPYCILKFLENFLFILIKNDTIEKLKESRKGSQRLNIDRRD